MSGPAPANNPATPPPVIPASLKSYIDAEIARGVEAALASRPNPPARAPITGKDLQLDLTEDTPQKRLFASLGLRMKAAYLARARHFDVAGKSEFKGLVAFMERTKSAGQFLSVFEQGGAFARETMSTELVALTRPNSILLSAGMRVISDYGSQLSMGSVEDGVKVYWIAEGEPPPPSNVTLGKLVLTVHKLGALARLTNDLMRLGAMDASALVGEDMAAAFALEIDTTGLKGVGPKRPNGVRSQMKDSQRNASAGTTVEKMIADTRSVKTAVAKANIAGGLRANGGFYYLSTDTHDSLAQLRDNGNWVFPTLQDEENPTLYGHPVKVTETLAGDKVLGFGLAKQFIMGEAQPLEVAMGENGNDFAADAVTMRGIAYVDFLLRYPKAFAEKTGVAY
ncbi:phage major capsid protein [Pyxidicoccus parkwayensis]|uniref:Phage major capsid protein n=1 Tax=Pyxidicoccus parkwayensis TaxID=2813578 RepID=A0ABX7P320_9BACT|nr:phage major capsid protein [Pyxidicoccus parkwaysis]QSQ24858.1 phage major capsid protein [Pyxidicoccus parkwaysis]